MELNDASIFKTNFKTLTATSCGCGGTAWGFFGFRGINLNCDDDQSEFYCPNGEKPSAFMTGASFNWLGIDIHNLNYNQKSIDVLDISEFLYGESYAIDNTIHDNPIIIGLQKSEYSGPEWEIVIGGGSSSVEIGTMHEIRYKSNTIGSSSGAGGGVQIFSDNRFDQLTSRNLIS